VTILHVGQVPDGFFITATIVSMSGTFGFRVIDVADDVGADGAPVTRITLALYDEDYLERAMHAAERTMWAVGTLRVVLKQ
jgi:hypothetical protein